jgi:hypothetical protein
MEAALRLLGIQYDLMGDFEDPLYICEWIL